MQGLRVLIICMIGFLSTFSMAEVPSRNYNPFALMVGLPELRSSFLLDAGALNFSVNKTLSNQWNLGEAEGESIFMDGEVGITDVNFAYGLDRWQLQLNVPWIEYSEGNLDPLVEDFHGVLSMPNAGREYFHQNKLLFSYTNDANAQNLYLDEAIAGVGDMRLSVTGQIKRSDVFASSVGMQLKLANADEEQWLGSGSYDLAFYNNYEWLGGNWQTQLQLGVIAMQDKGFLARQRQSVAGAFSIATNYRVYRMLWWTLQYDVHTALFKNSNLAPMSSGSMAAMALTWRGRQWSGHFAMLEDVAVQSSPDVGFQLGFIIHL